MFTARYGLNPYITQIRSVFNRLNRIYRGDTLDFLYKQVKMQRMKTANKSTPTLATRLDADTTYCHASGLLPRLQYTFFDRYASQHYTEWPKKKYTLFTHQYLWNKFK